MLSKMVMIRRGLIVVLSLRTKKLDILWWSCEGSRIPGGAAQDADTQHPISFPRSALRLYIRITSVAFSSTAGLSRVGVIIQDAPQHPLIKAISSPLRPVALELSHQQRRDQVEDKSRLTKADQHRR